MSIEFFTNPMSRGRIVHWMLEELGVEYTTRWTAFGRTGHKSPEYLQINPMGKLPAIRHDGAIVTETPAIVTYLALAFPERGLGPTPAERADFYRWMFFAAGPLEQAQACHGLGWEVPADKRGAIGFGTLEATVDTLAGLLGQRSYVCGERFTAADVYVGSQIAWGLQGETLPARPAFGAYVERLLKRAAWGRADALCNAQF